MKEKQRIETKQRRRKKETHNNLDVIFCPFLKGFKARGVGGIEPNAPSQKGGGGGEKTWA